MVHLIMRAGLFLVNIFYVIIIHIYRCIYTKKPKPIPPITNSIFIQSASALAKKIRQREITSYEVTSAYIKRIKEVNPFINAVVDERFKVALNEARICDERLKDKTFDAVTLEKKKPLYGIPISVKECCPVKNLSYTGCNLAHEGGKATADAVVVELLRDAGAIPLCVTNMPEMCCNWDSTNLVYGHTYNPYDARYSAGGSTGGEGALIAAGASLIGIGSDLAGSIKVPSLFCGVFGLQPTIGIIPTTEHIPVCKDALNHLTFGPMTRYADDLRLALKVMSGKCDRDLRLDVPVDLKKLKVYYREEQETAYSALPIAPEIKRCVIKAANYFSKSGVHTERLPIEWPASITEIVHTTFLDFDEYPPLLIDISDPKLKKHPLVELGKYLLHVSEHTLSLLVFGSFAAMPFPYRKADAMYYRQHRKELRQKLIDLLGDNGVFIYPTFRIPTTFPLLVLGEIGNGIGYAALSNVLGLPSVHVPMGLNRDGLPIGVQVIAAPYQDRLCLAVAKEMETAFGGWVPPSISITDTL